MVHVVSCSTIKKQTQSSPSLLLVSVYDSEHKCELALTAMALQRAWAESTSGTLGKQVANTIGGLALSYAGCQARCHHVRQVLIKLARLCTRTLTSIDWSGRM